MIFQFDKMHGAGNDFVMTHGTAVPFTPAQIQRICHRKRGAGADGLIYLVPQPDGKIRFNYFNADGSRAEMCGNGLRCAMEYAAQHALAGAEADFTTDSGTLHAQRLAPQVVKISMPDALPVRKVKTSTLDCWFTTVGVPHAVVVLDSPEELEKFDVFTAGRSLRRDAAFAPAGTNVDFIVPGPDGKILIRTYERGVEDETDACGTGCTASAVVRTFLTGDLCKKTLVCKSGDVLTIEFTDPENLCKGLRLTGPAVTAFRGTFDIN